MTDAPFVSLILLVYNHERFVAEAIRGALSQTYSPLEIILSDDCSKDASFAIIERETANYRGKHSIRLNRNARNLGFARHLSWLHSIIGGNLVVVAAEEGGRGVGRIRMRRMPDSSRRSLRRAMSRGMRSIETEQVGLKKP